MSTIPFNEETFPLINDDSDEEDTTEKQLYEHVEPNVVLSSPDETCSSDIQREHLSDQNTYSTGYDEDSETDVKNVASSDDTFDPNDRNKRSLPNGKKYHFFVSCSRRDEDLVKPIIRKLEQEGFRCMYDDRDFTGGKHIIENIIHCLQQSQKILLMMTPNFIESGPCMFEHNQAMHFYIWEEKRAHCSVPVLLRKCEIPSALKSLTYIEAEQESNLIQKIIESYYLSDSAEYFVPKELPPDLCIQLRQHARPHNGGRYVNGADVARVVASKTLSGVRGAGWQFNGLSDSIRKKLKAAEIQDAERTYNDIIKQLNSLWFMKLFSLFGCRKRCVATYLCFNVLFITWFVFLLITINLIMLRNYLDLWNALVIVVPILSCCGYPCIQRAIVWKEKRTILSILWKEGRKTFLRGKYFILLGSNDLSELFFIRYDGNPCLEQIELYLEKLDPTGQKVSITERAEDILKATIHYYLYRDILNWNEIPTTDERRHEISVTGNRSCFCRLAGIDQDDIAENRQHAGALIV